MIAEQWDTQPGTDNLWQAVMSRDERATFVYAVQSTGIYCRPACPSRRPAREQVRYFPLPDSARQAGFRPCKRCRPDDRRDAQVEMVHEACRVIDAHIDEGLTLMQLGKRVGSSPYHLQRTFKRILGISPRQYADALRLEKFKQVLRDGEAVTEAVYDAGYGSVSRLYERVDSQLGMVPATYRRGGLGARIHYTTQACRLGRLLIAATERGIAFVGLADSDDELEQGLRREFPAAHISRDDRALSRWLAAIVRYLDGQEPHLDLPLDVQATAFQRRVWQELQAIPYGETRTYREIAQAIGQPTASRAVGRACATNPVSLVIPCHRAVRTDGNLAGYRWGIDRKRALLEQEQS